MGNRARHHGSLKKGGLQNRVGISLSLNKSLANTILIRPIHMSPVQEQGIDDVAASVWCCEVGQGQVGKTNNGSGGVAVSDGVATVKSV